MTEYSTHIKTLILVQINSNENRIKGWGSRIIQRQSTLGTGPRMKTKRRSNTDSTHKKPGVLSKGNQFLLVIGHGVLSKGNQFLLVIGPVVLSKGNQFPLVIGTGVLSKGNQFLLVIGEWSLELKKNQTDLSLYKSLRNYLFTAFANYFVDRKYEVNSWIDIGIVLFILSLLSLHCSPLTL
jgi:hypothetical protein